MIDEEKQLDHTQDSTVEPQEVGKEMQNETMSADTSFNSDSEFLAADQAPDISSEAVHNTSATAQKAEAATEKPLSNAASDAALLEELAQARQDIESLKAQITERTTQYMRIAADFDNFRKRTQKEKEDLEQQIKCSTISEMLPVVDNFERARSQIKPQTEQEMSIHKSYQGVYKQLVDCLKRIGVSPMRSEGKEFDPNWHEAVMREATDQYPEGTVIEELVRGYLLGERVLRHAMVKVSAAPEPVAASEGSNQGEDAS